MGRGPLYFNSNDAIQPVLRSASSQDTFACFAAASLAAAGVAACTPVVDQRGNLPAPDEVAKSTSARRPATRSSSSSARRRAPGSSTTSSWYYISRKTEAGGVPRPGRRWTSRSTSSISTAKASSRASTTRPEGRAGHRAGAGRDAGTGARTDLHRTDHRQYRPLQPSSGGIKGGRRQHRAGSQPGGPNHYDPEALIGTLSRHGD